MQPVLSMGVHSRWVVVDGGQSKQNPIDAGIWEPAPDKPGYLRFKAKTRLELFNELEARLKAENLVPDEYFCICSEEAPLPAYNPRFICFVVRGNSEGYYIHIGFVHNGVYQDVFLGKTLREGPEGLKYACKIANACTRAFHS